MSTTYQSPHTAGATDPGLEPVATQGEPEPPARPAVADRFRRDIEGLRAVAVLLVVAYHAGIGVISGGYVGVDIFFVISGFLITGHLYRELERNGRISLRGFYARRMTRLLPASTVVVLGTLAAAWHWMPPLSLKAITWDSLAASTWAMNIRLAIQNTDYLGAQREPSPLQHFWSLAVEEQFYLVWPILLVLASMAWARRGKPSARSAAIALAVLSVASLALCIWQTTASLPWAYFGLHTRAWELGVGGLIALGAQRLATVRPAIAAGMTWLGLAAIATTALLYTDKTVFPGYTALLPVVGAGLVIAGGCATPRRGAGRLLTITPMQEIGRMSYSWYLWHWPVLILAPHVIGREPSVLVKITLMAAALVPASMSLAAVENRIRFHQIFRRRPSRGLALGMTLTVAAAGAALVALRMPLPTVKGTRTAVNTAALFDQATFTETDLEKLIRTSAGSTSLPGNLTPGLSEVPTDYPNDDNCSAPVNARSISYNIGRSCELKGDAKGTTTVVLFGDSHAQHWFDALNAVALHEKWRLVAFTKAACTPALGDTYKDNTVAVYMECTEWRRQALTRINQIRPAMVIMGSLHRQANPVGVSGDPDEAWAEAWRQTVRGVKRSGAIPVILQDNPFPGTSVPNCLSVHPQAIEQCGLKPSMSLHPARQKALRQMAAANGARVIETTPWFCTAGSCPAVVGNVVVYRDNSHITATYSRLLAGPLRKELLK